jgi:nucleoside-triphosphatase THEP1
VKAARVDLKTRRVGLLTGPVGVGKTTVAERVAGLARRQGWVCGGLLAPAMVNSCGQKAGIWGVDVRSGERRILARTDRDLGGPAVGPYSFEQAALDWALAVIESAIAGAQGRDWQVGALVRHWPGAGLAQAGCRRGRPRSGPGA